MTHFAHLRSILNNRLCVDVPGELTRNVILRRQVFTRNYARLVFSSWPPPPPPLHLAVVVMRVFHCVCHTGAMTHSACRSLIHRYTSMPITAAGWIAIYSQQRAVGASRWKQNALLSRTAFYPWNVSFTPNPTETHTQNPHSHKPSSIGDKCISNTPQP